MHLDVLAGAEVESLDGADPRGGGGQGKLRGIVAEGPSRVVAVGFSQGRGHIHIRQFVLHPLIGAYGAAKGETVPRIVAGLIQGDLGTAHLFEGKQDRRLIINPAQQIPGLAGLAQAFARRIPEAHFALRPAGIERGYCRYRDARPIQAHDIKGATRLGAQHQGQIGPSAIRHRILFTV